MNKLQRLIYNEGERLVPYVTHGEGELVRHRSSYAFFHAVIMADLGRASSAKSETSIADLGFGSGYGCALLSSLPGSRIVGVDVAPECEIFARQYYPRSNVSYRIEDLAAFIPAMETFDYVVSRGVLEHVPGGLDLIRQVRFKRRAMIDVPYDEAPGNEHHVLTGIRENAFAGLENCEIFYEDIEGEIYDAAHRPEKANMIMVVLSDPDLPRVGTLFEFPLPPVRDASLEVASEINATGSHYVYETPEELLLAVEKAVRETEVVLDIGCGVAPMNYFRPKLHILVEPWRQYADILSYRSAGDKSVIILRAGALEALAQLADNSVDSVFLLDVIEHLEKEEGVKVLGECERVAREQIVVFTPLGFMAQHVDARDGDGWGLDGVTVQEHRSGWVPEDFSAPWTFHICKEFHRCNFKGEALEQSFGAFFAIRSFENKSLAEPGKMTDFRRPLPSELEVQRLVGEKERLEAELVGRQAQLEQLGKVNEGLRAAYEGLMQSRSLRAGRLVRRAMASIGLGRG